MKTVMYLIDKGIVPPSVDIACDCGWLLITNPNMTVTQCSNRDCPIHNSHKLEQALKILGISAGTASKTAYNMLKFYKLDHHMLIFDPNLRKLPTSSRFETAFIRLQMEKKRLDKKGIYFYELIDAFAMDSIGSTRSRLIFVEFENPKEFYKKFDDSPEGKQTMASYIANKIKMSTNTMTVWNIVDDLMYHRKLILKVGSWFKFKTVYNETMQIAITGAITKVRREDGSQFKPRESIGDYWSKKYEVNILVTNLSKKNVQYLIMDTDMTSNRKFNKAQNDGITILTSKEFDDLLAKRKADIEGVRKMGGLSLDEIESEEQIEIEQSEDKEDNSSLKWI